MRRPEGLSLPVEAGHAGAGDAGFAAEDAASTPYPPPFVREQWGSDAALLPKAQLRDWLVKRSFAPPTFVSRAYRGDRYQGEAILASQFLRVRAAAAPGGTRDDAEQNAALLALAVLEGRRVPDQSVITAVGATDADLVEAALAEAGSDGAPAHPGLELRQGVAASLGGHCEWLERRLKQLRRLQSACGSNQPGNTMWGRTCAYARCVQRHRLNAPLTLCRIAPRCCCKRSRLRGDTRSA